jgi:hypothetical protein
MDYVLLLAVGAVIAVVAVPVFMLRKREYGVTFTQTGIGPDFNGTLVIVDGEGYDKYGASFSWESGSRHTFEFNSPVTISHGGRYVKQYVLASTSGATTDETGVLRVSRSSVVTGNYQPVFKISSSLPTVMNRKLGSARRTF